MLIFSLSDLSLSQKRFGGGLQTGCPMGMWKATALAALLAVNAFLQPCESLMVEWVPVVNSLESDPFRFAVSCVLFSPVVCLLICKVSCPAVSFPLSFPF